MSKPFWNTRRKKRIRTRIKFAMSKRRLPRTYYKSGSFAKKKKATPYIVVGGVSTVLVALIVVLALVGPRKRAVNSNASTQPVQKTTTVITPAPTATERVVIEGYNKNKRIAITEKQINKPSVYREGVVFSAGSGSIDAPVLKTLYYYDVNTSQLTKLWTSKLKMGEIEETHISSNWIVWIDTDRSGNNVLYKYNRATKKTEMIQECHFNMPKLRIYDDWLVWMEQTSKTTDVLHLLDLTSGEDVLLAEFSGSSYGMSAPCIYDKTLVYAGPDPKNPKDESSSAIYMLDLDNVNESGEITPEIYAPGGYVHEPVSNGEATAWIDTNKSPDARLYIQHGDNPPALVQKDVTYYSIGDDYIVYSYRSVIYAYFYKTDITLRLSEPGQISMLPVANENTVVWYDNSDSKDGDALKYKIME
jgi:hypothetical protein